MEPEAEFRPEKRILKLHGYAGAEKSNNYFTKHLMFIAAQPHIPPAFSVFPDSPKDLHVL